MIKFSLDLISKETGNKLHFSELRNGASVIRRDRGNTIDLTKKSLSRFSNIIRVLSYKRESYSVLKVGG
jgi:hypothetical protein